MYDGCNSNTSYYFNYFAFSKITCPFIFVFVL